MFLFLSGGTGGGAGGTPTLSLFNARRMAWILSTMVIGINCDQIVFVTQIFSVTSCFHAIVVFVVYFE